ncbi:MAG TPA: STAS domain-containing protein [Terriglobia bacterium]|nr:STAS domain-containing protein [Terriglobia bacterium]
MTINERMQDGVAVLALVGNFVGETESSLFQEKKFALLEAGRNRIVLDMSGLTMINSAGLGSLIAALVSTRDRGGDLRLAALTKSVAYIIEKVHLDTTLKVFESVDGAVGSFGQ